MVAVSSQSQFSLNTSNQLEIIVYKSVEFQENQATLWTLMERVIKWFQLKLMLLHQWDAYTRLQTWYLVSGTYVACIYDNYWWIGNIRNVCEEEDDVEITFMHPHGPSESFKWPRREDNCCVPIIHIICIIDDRSSNYINWETVQTWIPGRKIHTRNLQYGLMKSKHSDTNSKLFEIMSLKPGLFIIYTYYIILSFYILWIL